MEFWEKWKAEQAERERLKAEEEAKKNAPPKEIMDKLNKVDAVESKVDGIIKGLESLTAFADEYKKDKAEAAAKEAEAAKKKAAKTPEQQAEEAEAIAAALIDDPVGTVDKLTKGTQAAIMELRADNIRKEVFEDQNEFNYYTGDIKAEVDAILAKQTVQFRCQPDSVKNVYYTVIGRRSKEIAEGKAKSRFAQASPTVGGKTDTEKNEVKIDITPDIIKAARNSGVKPEEYVKLLENEIKEGNISYV